MTVRLGHDAIGEELFSAEAIALRVQELGAQFSREYVGKLPLFIGVLNAAAPFLADLTRSVTIPCEYDCIAVSKAAGADGLRIEKDTAASVEGRHIVLVDDIVDTGVTLRYVANTLRARLPASLAICTLLDRPGRRTADIEITY
ncbi:MAG: phosphoribosyltransferase, partial [Vulcanimicrobiaceae bacterium]